jgi:prolipoprotein diacylglyceryltransferase
MYPDGLITIGGEKYLTLYGICIAIGIVCCILTLHFLGNKLGSDKKFLSNVETIGYAAILAGLFSSALFQGIYNWIDGDGFSLTGGITFIGGLIGGVVTFIAIFFIVSKKLTGKFVEVLYVAPACIVVAHGFGRIVCFFAGC